MSVPLAPIRPATSRAWPPSPKVQSSAVAPGWGSRSSISSPASTGTCVRVMSRRMAKVLRDAGDVVGKVGLVGRVARSIPDLEVVAVADDDHVLRDPGVLEQRRAERDAPG